MLCALWDDEFLTGEPILPSRTANQYLAGEPILPSRTANQYLARYWFAVRDGKIGSARYWFAVRDGKIGSPGQILVRGSGR
jgi:hypothetical protein